MVREGRTESNLSRDKDLDHLFFDSRRGLLTFCATFLWVNRRMLTCLSIIRLE